MSEFANINRGLKDLFLPSSVPGPQPSTLTEDVQLVHPMFGPLVHFQDIRQLDATGAAGVLTIDGPTVPLDKVWYVMAADCRHNDTVTPQIVTIRMLRASPAFTVHIEGPETGTIDNDHLIRVRRAFLVPPGFFLRGEVNNLGGAFVVILRAAFLELSLADVTP